MSAAVITFRKITGIIFTVFPHNGSNAWQLVSLTFWRSSHQVELFIRLHRTDMRHSVGESEESCDCADVPSVFPVQTNFLKILEILFTQLRHFGHF